MMSTPRWNEAVKPVYDKMAADMNALGFPGTELVDFALGLAKIVSRQR